MPRLIFNLLSRDAADIPPRSLPRGPVRLTLHHLPQAAHDNEKEAGAAASLGNVPCEWWGLHLESTEQRCALRSCSIRLTSASSSSFRCSIISHLKLHSCCLLWASRRLFFSGLVVALCSVACSGHSLSTFPPFRSHVGFRPFSVLSTFMSHLAARPLRRTSPIGNRRLGGVRPPLSPSA